MANMINYTNPKNIKAVLDDFVMGQESGTKAIAMAVAEHLLQVRARQEGDCPDYELPTDNVLLIGPTGCGKTETFRVLERLGEKIGIPVVMVNALDYGGNGTWRNSKPVSAIFDRVLKKAVDIYFNENRDGDETIEEEKEKITRIANTAIIMIDEIDKIAMAGEDNALLFLKEYQSVLLKMIEGNTYPVSNLVRKKNGDDDEDDGDEQEKMTNINVDTTNMMFIFLGAFSGIREITEVRLHRAEMEKKTAKHPVHEEYQETHMGFLANPDRIPAKKREYSDKELIPSAEDVIRFGFMPELVGRIPVRTVYYPLSEDSLVEIMLHCKTSAYREYQRRFQQVGLELKCDRAALREIARAAKEQGMGARGLRAVFDKLLSETRYELSGTDREIRCLLRGKEIREHKPPLIHDRSNLEIRQFERKIAALERKRSKGLRRHRPGHSDGNST